MCREGANIKGGVGWIMFDLINRIPTFNTNPGSWDSSVCMAIPDSRISPCVRTLWVPRVFNNQGIVTFHLLVQIFVLQSNRNIAVATPFSCSGCNACARSPGKINSEKRATPIATLLFPFWEVKRRQYVIFFRFGLLKSDSEYWPQYDSNSSSNGLVFYFWHSKNQRE